MACSVRLLAVRVAAVLVLSGTALPLGALAETLVYKDSLIVEPYFESGIGARTDATRSLNSRGLAISEELGVGTAVIEPIIKSRSSETIVPLEVNMLKRCEELIAARVVRSCAPNYVVKATTLSTQLWGMTQIEAPRAWDLVGHGSSSVVAAVIDTGIDYTHADLAANAWVNPNEIPNNNIDDDANGYIDDVHGINAAANNGNPMDDNGHGTHVAGTIAANNGSGRGIFGVAPGVKVMGLKFLTASGSGSLAHAIKAINYMVTMKNRGVNIRVVNNSWGGGGYSSALEDAITRSKNAGIVFLAAAGNDANDNDASPSYPSSYEVSNVVAVAAHDSNKNLASFSNYGYSSVDISAPGVGILSTYPGNNALATLSGTSMATPHVTGALALLFSAEPTLTAQEGITRLLESGSDASTVTGLVRTGRILNVGRLVAGERVPVAAPDNGNGCLYTASTLDIARDERADESSFTLQGDDSPFKTVALPFAFPFYGTDITSITLSPNGVIYAGGAPSGVDYQIGSRAPRNSIAALHADLIGTSAPFGIRTKANSDSFTIYFKMQMYSFRNSPSEYVEVRTTLNSSGTITEVITPHGSGTVGQLASAVRVGVTGQSTVQSTTVSLPAAQNNRDISVSFVPSCGGEGGNPSVSLSTGELVRLRRDGSRAISATSIVAPGEFGFFASGTGNGEVLAELRIDGRVCTRQARISVVNGEAILKGRLASSARQARYLEVSAAGLSIKERIRSNRSSSSSRASRSLTRAQVSTVCRAVRSTLRTSR